jgi:chorismate dehydratase
MSQSDLITIGSVPYLNARPLVRWFYDTEEGRASGIRVVESVPSELARMLERGEVAAALVSSVELFRAPGLTYAPGAAVAAEGPVLSVRLLSRVPLERIRSVALDTSSLTSVALVKILLAERFGLNPQYGHAPPNLERMLAEADAALLIGDLGYREYDASLHVLDLGAAWYELTGLPFVYALWIGTGVSLTAELTGVLFRAKEWGKAHLPDIARTEYRRLNETYERTLNYLTHIMHYDVGPREEQGLRLFGQKARAQGLL